MQNTKAELVKMVEDLNAEKLKLDALQLYESDDEDKPEKAKIDKMSIGQNPLTWCAAEVKKEDSKLSDQKIRDSCIRHLQIAKAQLSSSEKKYSKFFTVSDTPSVKTALQPPPHRTAPHRIATQRNAPHRQFSLCSTSNVTLFLI